MVKVPAVIGKPLFKGAIKINSFISARAKISPFPFTLNLPNIILTFPNTHSVIAQGKSGANVDRDMVRQVHQVIHDHLGGDYGMIVDRREDYSLAPVQVFDFLNNWVPLKAIAIVTHRTMSKTIAQIDQSLSNKPLALFDSIEEAQAWIDTQLTQTICP